ncbi:uncharacterized protein SAPINGB_P004286 [Magnusiomyces paraingens]|uniref:Integrase catalytic domain-containing protein n=1 Tax=Magnusiomyces paraingens TaxID=2606893 RepID=A0A5E8C149_9ASCO|nr:uncharacterized protein SAPINGB_P004286 [Saprochaete ingens]VVT54835.1 unnamed protein product [Saprochaete ingens]
MKVTTVYTKGSGSTMVIIALYVDDLLISGNSSEVIAKTKSSLSSMFKMKDLGSSRAVPGMRVKQSPYHITVDVSRYILTCWRSLSDSATDASMYRVLLSPKSIHMEAAKHTLRYLKGTAELGLEYRAQKVYKLVGYSDADYAWTSRTLLSLCKIPVPLPVTMFEDNQGCIALAQNPVFHRRTKHIDVRYHVVRHYIRRDSTVFTDPSSFEEAMSSEEAEFWLEACVIEMSSLKRNGTWELVDLPPGRKAINSKWVFKVKRKADGSIERYKARLVCIGFSQVEGIDYTETFAPVVRYETVRIVLAIAAQFGFQVHHMDVETAFLNGDLKEDIYMRQPKGFVVKGQESKKIHGALVKLGFIRNESDYGVYTKGSGSTMVIIALYVDDLLISGNSSEVIAKTKSFLSSMFKMKDLGPVEQFLGMRVKQSPTILLWMFHGTAELGLEYRAQKVYKLVGYSDADYAQDKQDRKSFTGPASSSVESEYMSLSDASKECFWIDQLLSFARFLFRCRVTMFEDNQGCIALAQNPVFHRRTKHIDVRYHVVRHYIAVEGIHREYLDTQVMLADMFTKNLSFANLWHKRLGHASVDVLKKLSKSLSVKPTHFEVVDSHKCDACCGKATALPFNGTTEKASRPLELFVSDLSGPHVATPVGHRYVLTIMDYYSRYSYVELLVRKSDASLAIRNFIARCESYFSGDSAGDRVAIFILIMAEYISKDLGQFFLSKGIKHTLTVPHTPQQNGVAWSD